MEHRNPRPSSALDGPSEPSALSRPRLAIEGAAAPPPHRLLSRRRLIRVSGLGLACLVAVVGLIWAWGATHRWLVRLEPYQCRFQDLRLDPPPPPWIKAGTEGLLASIRQRAGLPEVIETQAIDPRVLRRAFANHSPWILEVGRIRRTYPNQLTLELKYREPVLEVRDTASGGARRIALLDAEAVVLPADETDLAAAGPLIRVETANPPRGLRVGLAWPVPADAPDLTRPDPAMAEVAQLAAFLKNRNPTRPPSVPSIKVIQRFPGVGLCLEAEGRRIIRWREPEGPPPAKRLTDEQQWELLSVWSEQNSWPAYPSYLYFVGGELLVRKPR